MGWEVVGYPGDPIPDDPGVVTAQVDHLRAVAATIERQLDLLPTEGNLDALAWDSDAAVGFRQVVRKLPHDLEALKARYAEVATALEGFGRSLANAKARAHQGLADAQGAADAVGQARAGVASMDAFATQAAQAAALVNQGAPPGTPPAPPEPWAGPDYRAQLAGADDALRRAKANVDAAVAEFHHAATAAAAAVHHAVDDSLKDDHSFFGSIKHAAHWLAERLPLEAISGLLAKTAAVLGVLAVVAAVIPGLQGVAVVLEGIAVGMAFVVLVCDAILTLDESYEGTAGWHNAIMLGIDAVAFGTGATAIALRGPARAAAVAAGTAGREATAAGTAARAATATRVASEGEVAAKAARVEQLGSGRVMPLVNRFLGRTGRAEAQLAQSRAAAAAASDAERQAVAMAQAKRAAAATAADGRAEAHAAQETWSRAGAVWGLDGAGSAVVHTDPGLVGQNPAKAVVVSSEHEWKELVHFRGAESSLARAGEVGGAIPAQPIR